MYSYQNRWKKNRLLGHSRFAVVTVGSEASSRLLSEKLPKREIHGQNAVILSCNKQSLNMLEGSTRKDSPMDQMAPMGGGGRKLLTHTEIECLNLSSSFTYDASWNGFTLTDASWPTDGWILPFSSTSSCTYAWWTTWYGPAWHASNHGTTCTCHWCSNGIGSHDWSCFSRCSSSASRCHHATITTSWYCTWSKWSTHDSATDATWWTRSLVFFFYLSISHHVLIRFACTVSIDASHSGPTSDRSLCGSISDASRSTLISNTRY